MKTHTIQYAGGTSYGAATRPDPTMEEMKASLLRDLRIRLSDPGAFVKRNITHDHGSGGEVLEPLVSWQARAVMLALECSVDDTDHVEAETIRALVTELQQKLAAQGEWVAVADRMPENEEVLLTDGTNRIARGWRDAEARNGWVLIGGSWQPTHWRPLPPPPEQLPAELTSKDAHAIAADVQPPA